MEDCCVSVDLIGVFVRFVDDDEDPEHATLEFDFGTVNGYAEITEVE
jgi:hypothetical protein